MAKIIVAHRLYGCETGCCGHSIIVDGIEKRFMFSHPYERDFIEYAKELITDILGEEHVKDLDWDDCIIIDK